MCFCCFQNARFSSAGWAQLSQWQWIECVSWYGSNRVISSSERLKRGTAVSSPHTSHTTCKWCGIASISWYWLVSVNSYLVCARNRNAVNRDWHNYVMAQWREQRMRWEAVPSVSLPCHCHWSNGQIVHLGHADTTKWTCYVDQETHSSNHKYAQ